MASRGSLRHKPTIHGSSRDDAFPGAWRPLHRPHLARQILVGLLCTALQLVLVLFTVLLRCSAPWSAANILAFVQSTQLDFVLSHHFTRAHRRGVMLMPRRRLLARCLVYSAAAG